MTVPPIPPISGVSQTGTASGASAAASAGDTGGPSFTQMIQDAVGELNASLISADQLAMALAAGEDVDLHQVMIALETASIELQTAIQIRNKAVEAYQQIMGMQV